MCPLIPPSVLCESARTFLSSSLQEGRIAFCTTNVDDDLYPGLTQSSPTLVSQKDVKKFVSHKVDLGTLRKAGSVGAAHARTNER